MTGNKQISFFKSASDFAPRSSHGGTLRLRKRKLARPLDRKKPLHIVMKSSHAKGASSLLSAKHRLEVAQIVKTAARRFRVKVHHFENVGSHLHLVASFSRKEGVQSFLRSVPALVARLVTRARRGHPFGQRFWDHLVFTRVVSGRRDFAQLANYMRKNEIEREFGGVYRHLTEQNENVARHARQKRMTIREVYEDWLRSEADAPGAKLVRA